MTDLNSLIPPTSNVTLTEGTAINDSGWIVANSATRAYLVTPSSGVANCGITGEIIACLVPPILTLCASGNATLCQLVCNLQCFDSTLISWTPPMFGDPWLDGTSLSIVIPTQEQALSLATDLKVAANTEPQSLSASERTTTVEIVDSTGARSYRALIVGPIVDIAASAVLPVAQDGTGSSPTIAELSLPFDASVLPAGTSPRMVRSDKPGGQWMDLGAQSVSASKHLIVTGNFGRTGLTGRFTVVAEYRD